MATLIKHEPDFVPYVEPPSYTLELTENELRVLMTALESRKVLDSLTDAFGEPMGWELSNALWYDGGYEIFEYSRFYDFQVALMKRYEEDLELSF